MAIGLSMGGNILLHIRTLQPDRIEAMVVVSPAMYFPEQARAIMRGVSVKDHPVSKMGDYAQAPPMPHRSSWRR